MTTLSFGLPDGSTRTVTVTQALNAGYAGRRTEDVQAHVDELAKLGIPGPTTVPTMYPVGPYLASQEDWVGVQNGQTSGEAEWALVVAGPEPADALLTVACDHTDRALEVHGVPWSKHAGPDFVGREAWRLTDVADHLDAITLHAWVRHGETEELIQDGTLAELLTPQYWLDVLEKRDILEPGTVLMSGTIPMKEGVDQFADAWRVEMTDPVADRTLALSYEVRPMAEPIE